MRDHQAHSMSWPTGRNQEAAKPDPEVKDPMDGNEISGILFQALRGATRLGQEGEATKKALLRAIEAAAEMGRPSEKTVMEILKLKAEAKREPGEEVAHQAETFRHWSTC